MREHKRPVSGWAGDVLDCVVSCCRSLASRTFNLDNIYGCVPALKKAHPENSNIEAKIRQSLQVLRDKGYIKFLGRGEYELTTKIAL